MDGYDFSEVKGPQRRNRGGGLVWNVLTILLLGITLLLITAFLLIYFNPNSFFNPFPPTVGGSTPTSSITPYINLTQLWTPTSVITTIPATIAPEVTQTTPIPTLFAETPISQPQTDAIATEYAFVVHQGSPQAIDGSQLHPDLGCNWSGVAGQVTSMNGEAVKGLFILIGGSLPGGYPNSNITMTGLAPQYGQGGYEIILANQPIASQDMLWIQLVDQQNFPLSNRIYFDTYDDCTKNLVIINFDQVR